MVYRDELHAPCNQFISDTSDEDDEAGPDDVSDLLDQARRALRSPAPNTQSARCVFNGFAGTPARVSPGGMSFATTAPAPTTDLAPIVTPGMMKIHPPIQAPSPTFTA